jgi:acetyltransferase
MSAVLQRSQLDRVFAPQSVAVVGASTDPSKRGNQVIRALREDKYPHPIYGVNPRGGSAYDVDLLPSVAELPLGTDLALVALPARLVPSAIRELGARHVAGAVVLADGFAEPGDDGPELQADLLQAVAESGVRVIGPNTSGVLNVPLGLNLVGLPGVSPGPVSVLTQSGNMLLSLVEDDRAAQGRGFAAYVGLGNQVDVSYPECLEHLANDDITGAIAVHSEGLPNGRAFLEAAARAARVRPIVMLRGGRSEAGKQTALSHTGSIAGSDAVATSVLPQAGIELVERSDELVVLSGVLATTAPLTDGTGVAVLADGGGHATLAADALTARGVSLAALSPETRKTLAGLLGATAALHNPVDVAGATDADPTIFGDAVEALMRDPAVGLVMIIGLYGGYHVRFDHRLEGAENATAQRLVGLSREHDTPLLVQSCYASRQLRNHDILREADIPVLTSIDHSVRAVAALARRGHWLATRSQRSDLILNTDAITTRSRTSPVVLPETEARQLVEEAGLKLAGWAYATSPDELESCLQRLATRCAVKVVSRQVVHKSEVGGVALDVELGQGEAAWSEITKAVTSHVPDAVIDGMIVAPMARSGPELLIGAARDPIFGPVVAFGSGGALVEAYKDVSFRAAPLTQLEARELISETAASRVLDGFRGYPDVDRSAIADLLTAVGDLMIANPEIVELDLNPVIAAGSHLQPVDVRIVVAHALGDDA